MSDDTEYDSAGYPHKVARSPSREGTPTCRPWCGTAGDDLPTRESNVWIYNKRVYDVNYRYCTDICRDTGRPLHPAPTAPACGTCGGEPGSLFNVVHDKESDYDQDVPCPDCTPAPVGEARCPTFGEPGHPSPCRACDGLTELAGLRAQLATVTRERDEARALLELYHPAHEYPEHHMCPACTFLGHAHLAKPRT